MNEKTKVLVMKMKTISIIVIVLLIEEIIEIIHSIKNDHLIEKMITISMIPKNHFHQEIENTNIARRKNIDLASNMANIIRTVNIIENTTTIEDHITESIHMMMKI
jgi:hypothetical protein